MAGQTSLLWSEAGTEAQSGTTGDSFLKTDWQEIYSAKTWLEASFLGRVNNDLGDFRFLEEGAMVRLYVSYKWGAISLISRWLGKQADGFSPSTCKCRHNGSTDQSLHTTDGGRNSVCVQRLAGRQSYGASHSRPS